MSDYKIAICDDTEADRNYIKDLVTRWAHSSNQQIDIHLFSSAEEFLFEYEEDKGYQILLLDIEMGKMDGVTMAKKLRETNDSAQIVFVTGYSDYIAEGYEVSALHYLMKPVKEDKLFEVLDRAVKKLSKDEKMLMLESGGETNMVLEHKDYDIKWNQFCDELFASEEEEEYREAFTRDGVSQRRIVQKHAPVSEGDYFKQILVILKTNDSPASGEGAGKYIMQQRSLKAKYYAGMWDATGGAVKAGETPEEAAVREVKEELGLDITVDDLVPAWDFIAEWNPGTGLLFSVFGCRAKVPAGGFSCSKREVNDVKIASFDEFYKCMMEHNDEAFGEELKKLEARL